MDSRYLIALAATLAVELVLVAAMVTAWASDARGRRGQLPRRRELLLVVVCANLVTHPVGWALIAYTRVDWYLLELSIAAVEALLLARPGGLPLQLAVACSLTANGATALLGWLLSW